MMKRSRQSTQELKIKEKLIFSRLTKFQEDAHLKSDKDLFKEISKLDLMYLNNKSYRYNIDGSLANIGKNRKSLIFLYFVKRRLLNLAQKSQKDHIYYNLGNTLLSIADIKYGHTIKDLITITELREARRYFSLVSDISIFPQSRTNLGNILDTYGRNYEAIQEYKKVLNRSPNFGMACGNKAKALLYYYNLISTKNPQLLYRAKELLEKAVKEENTVYYGGQGSLNSFKKELATVTGFIAKFKMRPSSQMTVYSPKSRYLIFCMKKNLFLNFCFSCFKCKQGYNDSLPIYFIDKVADNHQENNYMNSSYSKRTYYSIKTLNQIYEDYSTARYLYFHAINKNFYITNKTTKYISALDYCTNSLQYGLLKTAYIKLFNILDKLAQLIYTNYGIEQKNIYFTDLKSSVFETLIVEKNSRNLLALHSMAWDIKKDQIFHYLSKVRNYLTHEFIDIIRFERRSEEFKDAFFYEHHLSEDQIKHNIEDLFLLVKSALMYVSNELFKDSRVRKDNRTISVPLYFQN